MLHAMRIAASRRAGFAFSSDFHVNAGGRSPPDGLSKLWFCLDAGFHELLKTREHSLLAFAFFFVSVTASWIAASSRPFTHRERGRNNGSGRPARALLGRGFVMAICGDGISIACRQGRESCAGLRRAKPLSLQLSRKAKPEESVSRRSGQPPEAILPAGGPPRLMLCTNQRFAYSVSDVDLRHRKPTNLIATCWG